jgi:hypothetical protein
MKFVVDQTADQDEIALRRLGPQRGDCFIDTSHSASLLEA